MWVSWEAVWTWLGSVVVFGVGAELDSVNRKLVADVRLLNLRDLLI